MSISYDLALGIDAADAGTTARELHAIAGEGELVDGGFALASGLGVVVLARSGGPGANSVTTTFGIDAGVVVTFWISKFDDFEVQHAQMIGLVMALLDRVPADAVLHYQYDDVWLVRRGGQLVVSDDDDIWWPELLALVPPPVRRDRLEFAD